MAAYRDTEAHIGPREVVGDKGGSLYNRLKAVYRQAITLMNSA